MASEKRYREEILKTIYLIQTQLEKSDQMDWETVHEQLSQTAIKEKMWQRTEGGKGLRNNELIVQTFKDLRAAGLVTNKEGKQKAKLYFLTEHGKVYAGLMTVKEKKQKGELNLQTEHRRVHREEYLKQEQPHLIKKQTAQIHPQPTNTPLQSAFSESPSININQFMEFEQRRKSPEMAAFFSALFPGLGQIYGATKRRGVGIMTLQILLFLASIFINNVLFGFLGGIWLYQIKDGYQQVKKYNLALLSSLSTDKE